MRKKDYSAFRRMANGNLSNLFVGVVRVGIGHCQRIEEPVAASSNDT